MTVALPLITKRPQGASRTHSDGVRKALGDSGVGGNYGGGGGGNRAQPCSQICVFSVTYDGFSIPARPDLDPFSGNFTRATLQTLRRLIVSMSLVVRISRQVNSERRTCLF